MVLMSPDPHQIFLTREQVRRVDELAITRYGISGLILMENAGRGAAEIIDRAYGPNAGALVCCGAGNNGGDGCVIARHLHNFGWNIRLMLAGDESKMTFDMRTNYKIIRAMGLPLANTTAPPPLLRGDQKQVAPPPPLPRRDTGGSCSAMGSRSQQFEIDASDIVVDALLGTGFRGEVREPLKSLIEQINATKKRATVAIDVPSGLDCDAGLTGGCAVRANLTITFVTQKIGFKKPEAAPYLGKIEIVDIGAPREILDEVAAMAAFPSRDGEGADN